MSEHEKFLASKDPEERATTYSMMITALLLKEAEEVQISAIASALAALGIESFMREILKMAQMDEPSQHSSRRLRELILRSTNL